MRTRNLIALLAIAASSSACIVDINSPDARHDGTDNPTVANIPAVSLSSQNFAFAVLGNNFAYDQEYVTSIQSSDLRLAVAVSQYSAGSARLEVRDATNALVYAQQYAGNVAQSIDQVRGSAPFRVRVVFSTFTGTFAASLTPR